MRVFGDFTRQDLGWLFGSTDPKIVSGVVTWIGIALVGLAVYHLTRDRSGRLATDRPPVTAVLIFAGNAIGNHWIARAVWMDRSLRKTESRENAFSTCAA